MKRTSFSSVLVANRGEIALRIMRSVRAAGLKTIGVVTDVDARAPHARYADEVINIGRGPASDSYNSGEKILAAAKTCGAGAIHPGYGFLSENADFARSCEAAGVVFIGPSAQAIEVMGNKATAKCAMQKAGVPCLPGYEGKSQSPSVLAHEAEAIGYPVMIKAAHGGGGRGMRLVGTTGELKTALARATSEAKAAFGFDAVIMEKALVQPRHIEVQIFADQSGHTLHLGDRDCSVQRRHQKIIEEAPAQGINDETRAKMGAAAVTAARAVGYVGAGTVEFLLDADGSFYFLEMNTRLQVEHTVSEEVTGLDFVAMQLAVAAGRPLDLSQNDVTISGHAIEARLYAEDPASGFLPASGRLVRAEIATAEGLRVECGVVTGDEVSSFYDPMLAKLIVHALSRNETRLGLIAALEQSVIFGPATNRDFLIDVLTDARFAKGEVSTAFLSEGGFETLEPAKPTDIRLIAAAAALLWRWDVERAVAQSAGVARALIGWSSQGRLRSNSRLVEGNIRQDLSLNSTRDGALEVGADAWRCRVSFDGNDPIVDGLRVDGAPLKIAGYVAQDSGIFLATDRRTLRFDRLRAGGADASFASNGEVTAPMHGVLFKVLVAPGQRVERGAPVAILEAMKMQHEVLCDVSGVVGTVPFAAGAQVKAGALIVEVKPD